MSRISFWNFHKITVSSKLGHAYIMFFFIVINTWDHEFGSFPVPFAAVYMMFLGHIVTQTMLSSLILYFCLHVILFSVGCY